MKTLIKNISLNFITNGINIILSIVSIPLLIKGLGYDQFGLYILFNTFIGFATVLNNGILLSIIKKTVEAIKSNSKAEIYSTISSGIITNLIIGAITSLLFIFFGLIYLNFAKNYSPDLIELFTRSLFLSAISIPLLFMGDTFWTYPVALQKFELSNIKDLLIGGFFLVGSLVIVFFGGDIISIQKFRIFVYFTYFIFFIFILFKKNTDFKFILSFSRLKQILHFAFYKFISDVNGQLIFNSDKTIFSFIHPISFLPFYAVPVSIVQRLTFFISNIIPAAFPFLSEKQISKSKENTKYYTYLIQGLNIVNCGVMFFVLFNARQILELIVDTRFSQQSLLFFQILTIVYLIFSFGAIPTIMFESLGKTKIPAYFSVATLLLLFLSYSVLIPLNNNLGIPLSLLFTSMIMEFIFIFFTLANFKLNFRNILIYSFFFPIILSILSNYIVSRFIISSDVKLFSLIILTIYFSLSQALFCILLILFKVLDIHDINKVIGFIKFKVTRKHLH